MRKILTSHIFIAAIAAATIGLVSSASNARAEALVAGSCGNDSMCYSVPDGCGVGVGCQTAYCYNSACPSILGGDEICKFCEEPK